MGIVGIGDRPYAHMAFEDLNLHAFGALWSRSRILVRLLLACTSGQRRYRQKRNQAGQLHRFAKPTFCHV
ncbi:hypothetical protein D3C75_1225520 [compost metagenome]